jgi:hypothetical protein
MYFGLLRENEVLLIRIQDIQDFEDSLMINFPAATKHHAKGFRFIVPAEWTPGFQKIHGVD